MRKGKILKDPKGEGKDWAKDDAKKAGMPKPKKGPKVEALNTKDVPVEIKDSDRRWKAEDAHRDFERVAEHKQNPQLMNDVRKHARSQAKIAKRIANMEKIDPAV